MIAWTVLSILILLPSCSARPAPRKSYTEMFKCKLNFISMDEAQKAVQLGCKQMELAPPTSRFPASFIESELFDLTNIVLFTWPVFTSENVLRGMYLHEYYHFLNHLTIEGLFLQISDLNLRGLRYKSRCF
ncbi:putative secreted effector protein [Blumeria graminis f. sp. tritici 96224]|nr:putative secreted effector protein [Blumeria graminis f. sp. tritici 96224]